MEVVGLETGDTFNLFEVKRFRRLLSKLPGDFSLRG